MKLIHVFLHVTVYPWCITYRLDIMTVSIGILCDKSPRYGSIGRKYLIINTQFSANDPQGLLDVPLWATVLKGLLSLSYLLYEHFG